MTPEEQESNIETTATTNGFAAFAHLVVVLGTSTKTNDKLQALQQYFTTANDKDKVWVIAIFTGRKPKRAVTTAQLKDWCMQLTQTTPWLFEECYNTVGDLAETIALLLPTPTITTITQTLHEYIDALLALEKAEEFAKKEYIVSNWQHFTKDEMFAFNKLITGGFRIGVSQKMMVNALAKTTGSDASLIAHRISGKWNAASTSFTDLLYNNTNQIDFSKPYPFYLAHALDDTPHILGNVNEWQVEWKWDGIRGQMIKRNQELFVWSRGEELVTDKFPEYTSLLEQLPDGIVLDGEIIPMKEGMPLPFAIMQTRIGRKTITKKQLQEAPICFYVYDLLEYNHEDWRNKPLQERRNQLEKILADISNPTLQLSPIVTFNSWDELITLKQLAREKGAEGFMLKRKSSTYQVGRKVGDWWKWKTAPLTIDAVLIYAQKGHGRRSNLYTDYTFAVRDGDKLVSFTKAYSGLTDKEFAAVDAFVKKNAIEKFGPVRTVKPELVFEIAFEGIAASNRHKSGVALRFPRMSKWRTDKKLDEINTLDDLKQLLKVYGNINNTTK